MADVQETQPTAGRPPVAPAQPPAPSGGGVVEREFTVQARSQARMVVRRFLAHKLAVVSLVILLLLIVTSFVGGHLWHYKYADITNEFSTGPSLKHPFGTDSIGHDSLGQVLRGSQKSVQIALMVALLSTTLGVITGAVAGYYRGFVDSVLMRFTDLFLTFPILVVAGVLSAQFSGRAGGWFYLGLILAGLSWMGMARIIRGVFLSLREKEFVEAARALGASDQRIIFRHLLPNAVGPIIVNATIVVALAILAETALSFLGLGIRPPDTSLGLLVSNGVGAADTRPWLFYFPGIVIVIIALTVNFVGDGLRDAFDPTQTRVRA